MEGWKGKEGEKMLGKVLGKGGGKGWRGKGVSVREKDGRVKTWKGERE